jgi:hypothetical protein
LGRDEPALELRPLIRHRAPLDAIVLIVTALAAIPVGAIAVLFAWRAVTTPTDGGAIAISTAMVALLVATWGTSPTAYRLEPGRLVVERPLGEIPYPLAGLVEATPQDGLGLAVRVGNGGLFGITGWFWSRRLGWFRVHARKVRGGVVLRWPDRIVMVMPEDAGRFVRDVDRFARNLGAV